MNRLVRFYERFYPLIATALLSAAATALIAVSPIGAALSRSVKGLTAPDEASGAGFIGKIMNDWGARPSRFLHVDHAPALEGFAPVDGPFAEKRKARPLVFSRDKDRTDAFVIVGAFEFEDGLHGAILIDRKGRILHRWTVPPTAGRQGVFREDYRVFPHGFALSKDGSAVIAYDSGARLVRIDACGKMLWRQDGAYHHSVVADPENPDDIWTLKHAAALRLSKADGAMREIVRMPVVEEKNPELDIFGVRQRDKYTVSIPDSDDLHFNDADPLPAALASAFPQFAPGDLLVSARSPNLVFVVDRRTAKVKWHASGYWRRGHDPDWGRDGRIYVYNNNRNRGYSSIVAIDPKTMQAQTVVDGERFRFYSNIRGKHFWSPDGRGVITSPQQGRVFEVDERGEVSFEFLNRYDPKTGESLVISEAFSVDPDWFDADALAACSK